MANVFLPSGFGSRWLRRENSTSSNALRPGVGAWACAEAARAHNNNSKTVFAGNRILRFRANLVRAYTRERLRPLLREYFTGLRFGWIFVRPVPLFTSMIW